MPKTTTRKTYPMRVRPLIAEVASRTTPGLAHQVNAARCTCPDFTFRHAQGESPFCQHIIKFYLDWLKLPESQVDFVKAVLTAIADGDQEALISVLTGAH